MATITYKKASDELQKIVSDIEDGKVSIDNLYAKLERAKELIEICQSKLKQTDGEVKKLLSKK
jgi:exodeoxyribonuclease VII small subunit